MSPSYNPVQSVGKLVVAYFSLYSSSAYSSGLMIEATFLPNSTDYMGLFSRK
jgi:hypothetical protein